MSTVCECVWACLCGWYCMCGRDFADLKILIMCEIAHGLATHAMNNASNSLLPLSSTQWSILRSSSSLA